MDLGKLNGRGQNTNVLHEAIHRSHGLVWTDGKAIFLAPVKILNGQVESCESLKLGEFGDEDEFIEYEPDIDEDDQAVKSIHWSSDVGPSLCYLCVVHPQNVSVWKVEGHVPKLSFKQVRKLNVQPIQQGCLWNPGRDILCILSKHQCSFFFRHTQNRGTYAFPPIESGKIWCGAWSKDGSQLVLCVGSMLLIYSWPEIDVSISDLTPTAWRIPRLEGGVCSIVSLSDHSFVCAAELPLESLCKVQDAFITPDLNQKETDLSPPSDIIAPKEGSLTSLKDTLLNLPRNPGSLIEDTSQLIVVQLRANKEPLRSCCVGVKGVLTPDILMYEESQQCVVVGSNNQSLLQVYALVDTDRTLVKIQEIQLNKDERPRGISALQGPQQAGYQGILLAVGKRTSASALFPSSSEGTGDVRLQFFPVSIDRSALKSTKDGEPSADQSVTENLVPSSTSTPATQQQKKTIKLHYSVGEADSSLSQSVSQSESSSLEPFSLISNGISEASTQNVSQSDPVDLLFKKQRTISELRDYSDTDSAKSSPRDVTQGSEELSPRDVTQSLEELSPRDVTQGLEELLPRDVTQGSEELSPRDVTQGLEELSPRDVTQGLEELSPRDVTQGLEELSPRDVTQGLEELSPRDVTQGLEELSPRDVTQGLEELSPRDVTQGLKELLPRDVTQGSEELSPRDVTQGSEELSPRDVTQGLKELSPRDVTQGSEELSPRDVTQGLKELLPRDVTQGLEELLPRDVTQGSEELSPRDVTQGSEELSPRDVTQGLEELSPRDVTQGLEELSPRDVTQGSEELSPRDVTQGSEELLPRDVTQGLEELSPRDVTQGSEELSPRDVTQGSEELLPRDVTQGSEELSPRDVTQGSEELLPRDVTQGSEELSPRDVTQGSEELSQRDQLSSTPQKKKLVVDLNKSDSADSDLETETTEFSDQKPQFKSPELDKYLEENVGISDLPNLSQDAKDSVSVVGSEQAASKDKQNGHDSGNTEVCATTNKGPMVGAAVDRLKNNQAIEDLEREIQLQNSHIEQLQKKVDSLSRIVEETSMVFPTKYQAFEKPDVVHVVCHCEGAKATKRTFLLDNGRLPLDVLKHAFGLSLVELYMDGEPFVVGANIDGYIPMKFDSSSTVQIGGIIQPASDKDSTSEDMGIGGIDKEVTC